MSRHIIHLHIPAFSIAVARVSEARLRDRPVAVAPVRSERALILSLSLEARKEGVKKGMPLSEAVKQCPALTIVPPNPGLTERAVQALTTVAARYTPLLEPSRPGHVYLDVTGTERLWGKARDAGYRLRKEIKGRLHLPGTVGVSGNKMVSSVASRIISSETVLDVDHGREASFMAPLRVNVVPGIGPLRRKILLEELNIIRVRELAALDVGGLRVLFGRQAHVIHERALGIDPTPVYPSPARPRVSEEITFAEDENNDERLLAALYRLVERCSYRLRGRAIFPGKAGLLIRYSDQVEVRRRLKLPPFGAQEGGPERRRGQAGRHGPQDFDLFRPLEELFFKACKRRVRVRFMRIWFWDLAPPSPQLSLFHTPSPREERGTLVIHAMDRIRERYGEGAIQSGRAA